MNTTYTTDITSKQSSFLNRLLDEAVELLDLKTGLTANPDVAAREAVNAMRRRTLEMTRREASAAIDRAMDNNRILRTEIESLEAGRGVPSEAASPARRTEFVETGMYRVDLRIFKVLPSRNSDRHYAKELTGFHWEGGQPVADGGGALRFVYAKGAMALIGKEHRMSDAQAREFGRIVGACVVCGKLLTDPKSIEAGIGPVCADKR